MDRPRSRSPLRNGRPRPSSVSIRERWIEHVNTDWQRLRNAPPEIQKDPEIIGMAMRQSAGQALQFASQVLRADVEYLLGAAQELGVAVLQHAAEEVKCNHDFILQVTDYCSPGDVLPFVSEQVRLQLLSDPDFVMEAVGNSANGLEVLESASQDLLGNREFMLSLTDKVGGEALEYATPDLRAELGNDRHYLLETLQNVGSADVLQDASLELRSDRAFILECARHCPMEEILPWASALIRNEFDPEGKIEPHPSMEEWGEEPEEDEQDGEAAAEEGVECISSGEEESEETSPEAQRAALLEDVRELGAQALERAPIHLRSDRDFILEAAALCPPHEVLKYVSQDLFQQLFADASFVKRLLPHVGANALMKASVALRGDRAFMKAAEQFVPLKDVLRCAAGPLRAQLSGDPDFILRVLRGSRGPGSMKFASPQLLQNVQFLQKAFHQKFVSWKEVLDCAGAEARVQLCGDRDFMTRVVKEAGISALQHASWSLRADLGFMMAVAQMYPSQAKQIMEFAAEPLRELIDSTL